MNKRRAASPLRLGVDVIQLLIPQRRPFLMVDFTESYAGPPRPTLWAGRHISANEWVFQGHFPRVHIWPGALTIEGLGQTCNLLYTLVGLQRGWEERGGDPEEPLSGLRNLELGFRMRPGYRPEASSRVVEALSTPGRVIGFTGAVDVKLTHPVFPGQRLDYEVAVGHEVGDLVRFEIEASVDDQIVAHGTMTSLCRLPDLPQVPS